MGERQGEDETAFLNRESSVAYRFVLSFFLSSRLSFSTLPSNHLSSRLVVIVAVAVVSSSFGRAHSDP